MSRLTLRLDFKLKGMHPGDESDYFQGAVRAVILFERGASKDSLGPAFVAVAPDETSPAALFVEFEAGSERELDECRERAEALKLDCWERSDRESWDIAKRYPGARKTIRETYPLDMDDDATAVRRGLWHWARAAMYRFGEDGYIPIVSAHVDPSGAGPQSITVEFNASATADSAAVKQAFAEALAEERQRLRRAS